MSGGIRFQERRFRSKGIVFNAVGQICSVSHGAVGFEVVYPI